MFLIYTSMFHQHLDQYLSRAPFYLVPMLRHEAILRCVTFLFKSQSGSPSLIIIIPLHEGLIHRHQLPHYLPVILIHCQPAVTWEVVPTTRRNALSF